LTNYTIGVFFSSRPTTAGLEEKQMKSTRLLAAALVSMMASMGAAATQVMQAAHAPKLPKTIAASRTVGSSRNGGRRGGNRAYQRAAQKKRNQMRHRRACRG
jgi:ABC-type sugar transport system substrate-binding protein